MGQGAETSKEPPVPKSYVVVRTESIKTYVLCPLWPGHLSKLSEGGTSGGCGQGVEA